MCEWHCEKAVSNALHKKRKIKLRLLPIHKFKEINIKIIKGLFVSLDKKSLTHEEVYNSFGDNTQIYIELTLTKKEEEIEFGKFKILIVANSQKNVERIIQSFSYKTYLYFQQQWVSYLTEFVRILKPNSLYIGITTNNCVESFFSHQKRKVTIQKTPFKFDEKFLSHLAMKKQLCLLI